MTERSIPDPDVIRGLLVYEPNTGKLFWKYRPIEMFQTQRHCSVWNSKYAGKEAFTACDNHGYRCGAIFKISLKAHRVAWAIEFGAWPIQEVDHINGDRSDNRINNLRLASRSQNMRNKKIASHNKCGFKGVFWCKQRGKWRVNIRSDGQNIYIGHYQTPEQAHAAYTAAAEILHGKFARPR